MVTHTQTNSSNPISAAHTHQQPLDFTSCVGQMHHFERETSRVSLEYYLDCQHGHSSRTERDSDTKSPNCHTKLYSSTSMPHPYKQDLIFTESSSISCQNPIVVAPSEQLSPPPSPLYPPFASPVSPPSSSPPLFTAAFSVCSSGSLPQLLQLHESRALPTALSLNLDTREVFTPSQTTWRPWS